MATRDPDDPRFSIPSQGPTGLERAIRWGLLVVVGVVLVWTYPHWPNAWRWLTGREPLFVPEHEPNLDEVELDAVHRELFTDWLIEASRAIPGVPTQDLETARETMRNAIGADANLLGLFDELDGLVTSERLRGKGVQRRAIWLGRAWNHYLDEQGKDYFIHANVMEDDSRPMFYAHLYRVVGDAEGMVDDEAFRVRAVSRLDHLNLREAYLGYASNQDEGAVIISERVVELALDRIWPMLDERGDDRLAQLFAPMVVAELRRTLPGEAVAELSATAATRRKIIGIYDSIRNRPGCNGGGLWIARVPWSGYSRDTLDDLSEYAGRGYCRGITDDELSTLWKASEDFNGREGLQEATERLAAWVARAVAIHELRHVADDAEYDESDPRPCGPCVSSDPTLVRAEAAAYTAELAWSDSPALALYQVCETTAGGMGAHARARAVVMQGLGASCEDGVPSELSERARALEAEAFGRSQSITLGDGFPERLPVVAARDLEP